MVVLEPTTQRKATLVANVFSDSVETELEVRWEIVHEFRS